MISKSRHILLHDRITSILTTLRYKRCSAKCTAVSSELSFKPNDRLNTNGELSCYMHIKTKQFYMVAAKHLHLESADSVFTMQKFNMLTDLEGVAKKTKTLFLLYRLKKECSDC